MMQHRITCSLLQRQVFSVSANIGRYSIRSMRDASVGICWIGSGAAGKAAFMLVREVSAVVDIAMLFLNFKF